MERQFNTPWRVASAAIYTTPTDARVYGTLDIDVEDLYTFIKEQRKLGLKVTIVHVMTAILGRALAFDVPEINCFIRRGDIVKRKYIDVMVPVAMNKEGVTSVIIEDSHAKDLKTISEELRRKTISVRSGEETRASKNKYILNAIPWPFRRLAFRLFKWVTIDLGIEIESLGLNDSSFGSIVLSDIGSHGLTTGMTALLPAGKVPAVIVLGKIEKKVVVRNGNMTPRMIMPITGTFDHRIVDGAQIGKLARSIKRKIKNPQRLLLVPHEELSSCIFERR